jgi:hypothetical protein
MVMDAIFGHNHFIDKIIWKRICAHSDVKRRGNIHDNILLYSKYSNYIWKRPKVHMARLEKEGLIAYASDGVARFKRYLGAMKSLDLRPDYRYRAFIPTI